MNGSKWVKRFVRVLLYCSLVAVFVHFYLIDELTDFFEKRTTITSKTEKAKTLEPPTVTVCPNPGCKTSVAREWNIGNPCNMLTLVDNVPSNVTNDTLFDFIDSFHYHINKDYYVALEGFNIGGEYLNPQRTWQTNGKAKKNHFKITPIKTISFGTCVNIQPTFQITSIPFKQTLGFMINPNLLDIDKIEGFTLYLTSNEAWHSIVWRTWVKPLPQTVEIDIQNVSRSYLVDLIFTEHLSKSGSSDTNECIKNAIMKSKCNVKCNPFFIQDETLPMCSSKREIVCIAAENDLTECIGKKQSISYQRRISKHKSYKKSKQVVTQVALSIRSMNKEVREEVQVITSSTLIGSIGGSLGMFFGFSFSGFVLCLMDKLAERQIWIRNSSQK